MSGRDVVEAMKRAVIAWMMAPFLTGCIWHGASLPPPASPAASADAATLLGRPLKLPAVGSGSACPVTPVSSREVNVTDPRGHGPFYLGGPMPQGHFPWNKTGWILMDGARGPVRVSVTFYE